MTGELSRVADAYNRAAREGRTPGVAVRAELGLSKGQAHRRIDKARQAGLIEDFGPSGYINRRAMLVANALGVPYRELVAAILEHADGAIRVEPITRR
jgi:DNA-binding Lrp family transcriptional regulator